MLNSIINGNLTLSNVLICSICSIILGLIISLVYKSTSKYGKNFVTTLAVLPVLVQSIIFMTNGSLGTSIAILGAFSLVRFRSIAGTSKEIICVFFAVAVGLATGIGHIYYAFIITIIVSTIIVVLYLLKYGEKSINEKILRVVVPEDMDYEKELTSVLSKYTKRYDITNIRTINLGSLFEITYEIKLKDDISIKEFLDELRLKNENLKIILSNHVEVGEL